MVETFSMFQSAGHLSDAPELRLFRIVTGDQEISGCIGYFQLAATWFEPDFRLLENT